MLATPGACIAACQPSTTPPHLLMRVAVVSASCLSLRPALARSLLMNWPFFAPPEVGELPNAGAESADSSSSPPAVPSAWIATRPWFDHQLGCCLCG